MLEKPQVRKSVSALGNFIYVVNQVAAQDLNFDESCQCCCDMSPEQSRDPVSLSHAAKLLQIPARYFLHVWFPHQVVGKETSVHEPEQHKKTCFLRSDPV